MTFALLPQSLDELDDDEPGERERSEEEALVQANTYQNEAMAADSHSGHPLVRRLADLICSLHVDCPVKRSDRQPVGGKISRLVTLRSFEGRDLLCF